MSPALTHELTVTTTAAAAAASTTLWTGSRDARFFGCVLESHAPTATGMAQGLKLRPDIRRPRGGLFAPRRRTDDVSLGRATANTADSPFHDISGRLRRLVPRVRYHRRSSREVNNIESSPDIRIGQHDLNCTDGEYRGL
ncbi:hypothetical protein CPLU01_02072 [Colletotrichum plurivorum]|uniref:Uncharacterized protein n=1 Tax=Colletotrichum plurivorum TaxID=2175906 RepID=A0A8H6NN86_9PEZI|nr:hypothetical protein CPLU01_02072 [Colletotrichum plurivorum]